MELANIEKLLDAYFEGETSLTEEALLRDYFTSGNVAPHLQGYIPMFEGFSEAKEERLEKEITILQPKKNTSFRSWSIAASVVVLLGISSFWYFNNNAKGLTAEQEEALMAYNEAKQTMLLLSESLNKGASKVSYIDEFIQNTATINIINQFNETKNKILK
ncbi:MAG: hypothetical protein R2776_09255 [Flavobacteriaceae bacterium]|nr:hypothetical protein [Flavobacteriaceae bacterium]